MLAQGHDSITFQVQSNDNLGEIVKKALELTEIPLYHKGRKFVVPGDCKVGFNYGKYDEKLNPNGLRKWKGSDDRKRVRVESRDRMF